MRQPKIENKYNLTISDCRKLKISDRSKIKHPLFCRNSLIDAWYIIENVGTDDDRKFCTDNSYWIGVYDDNAKAYAGKMRFHFSTWGGMCGYKFGVFFREKDIENDQDLRLQEAFLSKINYLIDEGILVIK